MQARTPKAAEVRAYFLTVEKALFSYREEIEDGMSERIGIQKHSETIPSTGIIYIIRASEKVNSVYKIGRTTDLIKRLQLQSDSDTANEFDVVYIYKTNCIEKVESCMKMMVKEHQYRKYKEVYQIDIQLLKKVIKGCDDACIASAKDVATKVKSAKSNHSKVSQVSQHKGGYYAVIARN
jgi:hypothetical protein